MAISIKDRYPSKVDTTDAAYPQGKARNVTVSLDGTGTPFEKDLVNDIMGLQQAIYKEAGITPSGTPDTADVSQQLDGLKVIQGARSINNLSQTYTFPTVAAFKASLIEFPDGKIIHLMDRGADFTKVSGNTATLDHGIIFSTNVNQSISLIASGGIVTTRSFGAVGGGAIEEAALQAALDFDCDEVRFGDLHSTISEELILPWGKVINLGTCTIQANYETGNVLATKQSDLVTTQPIFKVIGNRAKIFGTTALNTENLVGLWIGTCKFSSFGGFEVNAIDGNPVVLGATGVRDIISITLHDIETNTGDGLHILSGFVNGVDYQEVTTGTIKDCFWSVIGLGGAAVRLTCNDKSAAGDDPFGPSSIFGINFERCSLNSTHVNGGEMLNMARTGISSIHRVNFYNCEGETRDESLTPVFPAVNLLGVNECIFEIAPYMHKSAGLRMVDCSKNTFNGLADGNVNAAYDTTFITLDVDSNNNTFNNANPLLSLMSTDHGFSNAPLAAYFFTNRIVDAGINNSFTGMISTNVNRVFKTDYLSLLSSTGKPIDKLLEFNPSTTPIVNNGSTYTATFANTASGFIFDLPLDLPLGTNCVFRINYRFVGSLVGQSDWRFQVSRDGTSKYTSMPITNDWTEVVMMSNITGRRVRVYSPVGGVDPASIEFSIVEVYTEAFPYIHNYIATDVYKNSFQDRPYSTATDRPVGVEKGFSIFNTTTNQENYWSGTDWLKYDGTAG